MEPLQVYIGHQVGILSIHLPGHQTDGMEHLLADRLNLITWQCESDLSNEMLGSKVIHVMLHTL